MINTTCGILVYLVDLSNEINPDIGTLKKDRVDVFSEFRTEIFKAMILCCDNEVIFERLNESLRYKYFGGTNPTAM